MNNSSIYIVRDVSPSEKLQEHEAKLIRIIEAVGWMKETDAWSTLKTEVFDGLATNLKRELLSEAKKDDPDPQRLNRLAGELKWADRFADLDTFAASYRVELTGVRQRLHGKSDQPA